MHHLLGITLLVTLALVPSAQVSSQGSPLLLEHAGSSAIPTVVLEAPDVARLMAEDEARGHRPYRYGAAIEASLDMENRGIWENTDGQLVWRLRIQSPGALSLGLELERFALPEEGQLYVYDPEGKFVLGAYTAENQLANGMFAIQPMAGDVIVLEYNQPADAHGQPELVLGRVIHDYRGILVATEIGSPQAYSGGCQIDSLCPEASPYQDIRRSVVMLLQGGGQCSGVLLNNTSEDETPYFYTANHCGNFTNVIAVFGYERDACDSGASSQMNTVAGATLLRSSVQFDGQLYQLSAPPPASYEPFYAGWDRRGNPPGPTANFSHPGGQPKKFCLDDDAPVHGGSFWDVQWELGLIQGGSSGSPLYNGEQRVIGTACCVNNFSCGAQTTSFGRFNGFWNNFDLSPWLDSIGLGVNHIDGFDPYLPIAIAYNGMGINPEVYVSTAPPGVGQTWTAEVDSSPHPTAGFSVILGHTAPSTGIVLPLGELLIDLLAARHFASVATVSTGLSQHSNDIPNDMALVNVRSYTQGFLFGGGTIQATNGVELRLK